jgi:hypothetical protein
MSQIQKRLNDLQPYVAGIRFVQSVAVVDVVFKEGWNIPESKTVHKEQSEQDPNYYLSYSEKEGIGFDELLDYVEGIIKINIEREVKQELLKIKVKELQIVFKENSLDRLKTLKFVIGKDSLVPDLMSDEIDIEIDSPPEIEVQEIAPPIEPPKQPQKAPSKEAKPKKPGLGEIELPPKGGKIALEVYDLPEEMTQGDCSCGENEACPKCMDRKGL